MTSSGEDEGTYKNKVKRRLRLCEAECLALGMDFWKSVLTFTTNISPPVSELGLEWQGIKES